MRPPDGPVRRAGRALVVLAAGMLASCVDSRSTAPIEGPLLASPDWTARGRVVLVGSVQTTAWPADPLMVGAVQIDGDSIRVAVSFGGGCRGHAVQLISETTWMESYPVQVNARLAHNSNADPCDALIGGSLHFDLSPLRERFRQSYNSTSGRIQLRLAGAASVPVYVF